MQKHLNENAEADRNVSILTLFTALTTLNKNADDLVNEVVNKFEAVKDKLIFDVMDVEAKEIYQKRMSWHSIREYEEDPEKVNHAIIEVATDDLTLSLGYNPASNFLSFSKDGGPVKFYSFMTKVKPGIKLLESGLFEEFKIIMERLLD